MSFYDLPTVDENSKISEESVLAVRMHFKRNNGYILRIDDPDYGCDVTMELIIDASKASGQRFPAQIKSSGNLSFLQINDKEFVSINFPTSTLGYLSKHAPTYGIILVYDDNTQACYFDYVEAIINRITQEKESEEWKNQKTVAIHLPIGNILNIETIADIHQRFKNRFEAHESLLQMFGSKFDIPNFSSSKKVEDEIELTAADLLKKYGNILLTDHDIFRLYQLLSQVPFLEIVSSKELILIAAIVYSEMGKCIEGEFYLNKSDQIIDHFTNEEVDILKFTRIKVDYLLGKRSKNDYYEDLKSLKAITNQPHNLIQIQINLLYYQVLEQVDRNQLLETTENELLQLLEDIDKAELSERQKHIYKLFHAENIHMFISSQMLKYVTRLRFRESVGEQVSQLERINQLNKTNEKLRFLTVIVLNSFEFANITEDRFLKAHSYNILSRFFLIKEFDFMLLNFHDNGTLLKTNFKRAFLQSIEAHNLFLSLGLFKEAYQSLQNSIELSRLAKLWYNIKVTEEEPSEESLWKNIRAAELEMGIKKSFTSMVDNAYINMQNNTNGSIEEQYKNFSDEQIDSFASLVLETYELPIERKIHIVNEIKSYRFFHQYCDTDNFELLCNLYPHQNPITKYAFPTSYILVSKRTGIRSSPGTDVEQLAKAFGALK